MTYTKTYRLPQWERADPIRMSDFNQLCASIETGIDSAKDAAAALSAQLEQKIAAAQAKADAAFGPDQLPYVVGTYDGTSNGRYIILGFKPSFVIISGLMSYTSNAYYYAADSFGICGENVGGDVITFTSAGFKVNYVADKTPYVCRPVRPYDYIAFR